MTPSDVFGFSCTVMDDKTKDLFAQMLTLDDAQLRELIEQVSDVVTSRVVDHYRKAIEGVMASKEDHALYRLGDAVTLNDGKSRKYPVKGTVDDYILFGQNGDLFEFSIDDIDVDEESVAEFTTLDDFEQHCVARYNDILNATLGYGVVWKHRVPRIHWYRGEDLF